MSLMTPYDSIDINLFKRKTANYGSFFPLNVENSIKTCKTNNENAKENDHLHDQTLLSRQGIYILPISLFIYIILQYGIYCIHKTYDFCIENYTFPNYINQLHLIIILFFCIFIGISFVRILISREKWYYNMPYYANLTILSIALSSSILTFLYQWGGLCRDSFHTLSPAAQWPEWLISVPLLFYCTCSCSYKSSFELSDIIYISCMFITIFCGFLLVLQLDYIYNIYLLLISCSCVLAIFYFLIVSTKEFQDNISIAIERTLSITGKLRNRNLIMNYKSKSNSNSLSMNTKHPSERIDLLNIELLRIQSSYIKKNLAIICSFGMPLFPMLYFLSAFHIISDDHYYIGNMIAGMITKCIIATFISMRHFKDYNFIALDINDKQYNMIGKEIYESINENISFLTLAEGKFYKTNFNNPDKEYYDDYVENDEDINNVHINEINPLVSNFSTETNLVNAI